MIMPVIPTPLYGRKVELHPFVLQDITPTYIGWLNDPQVTKFSNQRFYLHDEVTSKAYLATFFCTDNIFCSIRTRIDGNAVGTITAYINRHHETADIGLMIGNPASWGKGFGQDAWDTLSDWLLNVIHVRKLTAGTAIGNTGMVKIMQRSGMTKEAVRCAQEIIDGQPHDIVYFARFHV